MRPLAADRHDPGCVGVRRGCPCSWPAAAIPASGRSTHLVLARRRRRQREARRGRDRADPGPRRPAHAQRADLPVDRRRRGRASPSTGSRSPSARSITSTLVQIDGNASGSVYNLDASFRLVRIADKTVALQARATAARLRALRLDLRQRARPRGRREPRRQDRRRRSQIAPRGLSVERRLSAVALPRLR